MATATATHCSSPKRCNVCCAVVCWPLYTSWMMHTLVLSKRGDSGRTEATSATTKANPTRHASSGSCLVSSARQTCRGLLLRLLCCHPLGISLQAEPKLRNNRLQVTHMGRQQAAQSVLLLFEAHLAQLLQLRHVPKARAIDNKLHHLRKGLGPAPSWRLCDGGARPTACRLWEVRLAARQQLVDVIQHVGWRTPSKHYEGTQNQVASS
mmetsp:Transcript_58156/g.138422  ORF Transcript_58156/g.138422 Transcript_58156/m.138422 type:complete len:209 (-) Transcript_58156:1490-2116(-)